MIVFGFHPVRELLRHRPEEVEKVLIGVGRGGRRRREVEELCSQHGIECETVPDRKLDGLAAQTGGGEVHNGFIAHVQGSGAESTTAGRDAELVVLLEDVQDPRNLGAILRVCEGAGVSRVLIRDKGSAPVTAVVTRTSAGASEWLEVERVTNTATALRQLKEEGFWVYGADASGQAPWDLDLSGKVVLCFGGEEKGLRHLSREVCDGLVGLPMRGRIESLNVSAAAAAVLYEAVRQRLET